MPRMWLYHDTVANESGLRITRDGGADDPNELAVTDWGEMLFDSLNPNQFELIETFKLEMTSFDPLPGAGQNFTLYPLGSTAGTATYRIDYVNGTYDWRDPYELIDNTQGLGYPNICFCKKYDATGWLLGNIGRRFIDSTTDSGNIYKQGEYVTYNSLMEAFNVAAVGASNFLGYTGWAMHSMGFFIDPGFPFAVDIADENPVLYAHLPLPADETAWNPVNGTPSSGDVIARITPATVKVARPGFDVDSATAEQLLIDSTKTPLKIVASGQITVNAGTASQIALPPGIVYSDKLFVDYIAWVAGDIVYHPTVYQLGGDATTWALGLRSKVISGVLHLDNPTTHNVVCRYIVFGFDDTPQTSGTSKVLFQGNDGTQDYIQIRRPGASDTPALSDVLLDSRFPYCPVLTNGFAAVSAGSPNAVVNFSNPGTKFYPYPIFTAKVRRLSDSKDFYRGPYARTLISYINLTQQAYHGQLSGDSVTARIENTSVTFVTNPAAPSTITNTGGSPPTVNNNFDFRILGVRYYILALPIL